MDKELNCLRCNAKLQYSGVYKFFEGKNYGIFGNLFELFVKKRNFDVYICPQCGKAEFYSIE